MKKDIFQDNRSIIAFDQKLRGKRITSVFCSWRHQCYQMGSLGTNLTAVVNAVVALQLAIFFPPLFPPRIIVLSVFYPFFSLSVIAESYTKPCIPLAPNLFYSNRSKLAEFMWQTLAKSKSSRESRNKHGFPREDTPELVDPVFDPLVNASDDFKEQWKELSLREYVDHRFCVPKSVVILCFWARSVSFYAKNFI